MFEVKKLIPHGFSCNCYLVSRDGKTAIAIDPGSLGVESETAGLEIRYVLLTHGHFDHIRGCQALQRRGAKIGCLQGEEKTVFSQNLGEVYGDGPVPPFEIDFTFRDGEEMELCGIRFTAISTPGHTSGGACLLTELEAGEKYFPGILFSGDTLFQGSVGRTDGPSGNDEELLGSLKKLCALEKDYFVFPGHGPASTLSREKMYNRYLRW